MARQYIRECNYVMYPVTYPQKQAFPPSYCWMYMERYGPHPAKSGQTVREIFGGQKDSKRPHRMSNLVMPPTSVYKSAHMYYSFASIPESAAGITSKDVNARMQSMKGDYGDWGAQTGAVAASASDYLQDEYDILSLLHQSVMVINPTPKTQGGKYKDITIENAVKRINDVLIANDEVPIEDASLRKMFRDYDLAKSGNFKISKMEDAMANMKSQLDTQQLVEV